MLREQVNGEAKLKMGELLSLNVEKLLRENCCPSMKILVAISSLDIT